MAIGSGRWGGLRQEPYNPNPKDADNDGIVQEGTPFERPIGTRYLTAAGEEISSLLDGSNVSQLDGLRLVDANDNPVQYSQSWRSESLSIGERQETLGQSLGTVGQTLGTIDKVPSTGDYRIEHRPPGRGEGAPLHAMDQIYPPDVYSGDAMRLYGSGLREDAAKDREMFGIMRRVRGNPDAEVIMYRAVPADGVDTINPGDWVTPSRLYAVEHGEGPMRGEYRIIEMRVRAGDLHTDGNYIYEFGYDPMPVAKPVDNRDLTPAAKELHDDIIPSWGSGDEAWVDFPDLSERGSALWDAYSNGEIDGIDYEEQYIPLVDEGRQRRLDQISRVYGEETGRVLDDWVRGDIGVTEGVRDDINQGAHRGLIQLIDDSPPKDTLWRGMMIDAETQQRMESSGVISMPLGATSTSDRAAGEYAGLSGGMGGPQSVMIKVEGANAFPARTVSPVESDDEWLVAGDFEIVSVGEYVRPGALSGGSPVKQWTVRPRRKSDPESPRANVPKGKEMRTQDKGVLFSSLDTAGEGVQENKVVNPDGTLSIEGMNADGSFIEFDPELEDLLNARYEELGVTRDELTLNLAHSAMLAMGYDPVSGTFDPEKAEEGLRMARWYSEQSDRLRALADAGDVDMERVVAAATVMSAGRLWDGPANGNYESTERLINILKADEPIEVTSAMAAFMRWRKKRGQKATSKLGFHEDLKSGQSIRPSELDSNQLVEVLYAANSLRGYTSFKSWLRDSEDGKKSPSGHRGVASPYPLFTSKGTLQVKQAVAVMRGDVSVREAISGPKYSSFYSNLLRPDLDYSSTNDTWHYRVMAGNLVLNPLTKKKKVGSGTMRELTLKDEAKYGATVSAQDLFQSGLARLEDGLGSGDLMFRDSTKMTRGALAALRLSHPEIFGDMKLHEIQALVWVYFGGGTMSADEGLDIWDDALRQLPIDGSWVDLVG
jgi:hypothetical protein